MRRISTWRREVLVGMGAAVQLRKRIAPGSTVQRNARVIESPHSRAAVRALYYTRT